MDMFKDKIGDLINSTLGDSGIEDLTSSGVGDFMNSGIGDQLQGLNFPASKDEILGQLEQTGVPDQVLDRVRDVDTSQFDSVEELRAKIGM